MPRNQFWTAGDAAATVGLSSWNFPDANLSFTYDPKGTVYDAIGTISGQFTSGEVIDYINVNLTAGSSYTFVATGSYQVSIAVYDAYGYLLVFTDGDDIGLYDSYPTDSIIDFKPDYTGQYKLSIYYQYVTTTGSYALSGVADYGANDRNDGVPQNPQNPPPAQGLSTALTSILRGGTGGQTISNEYSAGTITFTTAVSKIIQLADSTTSVASMSYQFFTGQVPTKVGIDFLVSPTGGNANNLNSAYYAQFDTVNRYINFAVNLGKNGEAKDSFAKTYGSLSLFDATKQAYKEIFGGTPTDAKVHSLIDTRVDYLASYGGDGANGIGTKAAMVGFLLAAAATENVGIIAKSNDAWLMDLSDGSAPFQVNLLAAGWGYYKADFIFGG